MIVDKSSAAERNSITVLPFPNADGSCSVLSNYIVDELILSLFSVENSRLDIVERAQLEALIAEMQIGEGGLLNPETTKQLGNLAGISALTLGTITVIGDSIRLNARLVATETGRTISAAAVTIPRTEAMNTLLKQPVTTGPTCGLRGRGTFGLAVQPQPRVGGPALVATLPPGGTTQFAAEGLQFTVQGISRSKDKKAVNVTLGITNTTEALLPVVWVQPGPNVLDNMGNELLLQSISGHQYCNRGPSYCAERKDDHTIISSYSTSIVNLRFATDHRNPDTSIEGTFLSVAGRLVIVLDGGEYKAVSVSLPGIEIPQQ